MLAPVQSKRFSTFIYSLSCCCTLSFSEMSTVITFNYLRKRGPLVVSPPESKDPSEGDFQQMVVEKFINDSDFDEEVIKA